MRTINFKTFLLQYRRRVVSFISPSYNFIRVYPYVTLFSFHMFVCVVVTFVLVFFLFRLQSPLLSVTAFFFNLSRCKSRRYTFNLYFFIRDKLLQRVVIHSTIFHSKRPSNGTPRSVRNFFFKRE